MTFEQFLLFFVVVYFLVFLTLPVHCLSCLDLSREKALQDGLKAAVQVPLNVIQTATKVWNQMVELAKVGNINSKSDLQVHGILR